jgi:hypothetical protein
MALLTGCKSSPDVIEDKWPTIERHFVAGAIWPLRQPTPNACWATVAAMMVSWLGQERTSPEEVAGYLGGDYVAAYERDTGLAADAKAPLLRKLAMRSEYPANYTVTFFRDMLLDKGPLWVTLAGEAAFSTHATLVTGIEGDGTVDATRVWFVDPSSGELRSETYRAYMMQYEGAAEDAEIQVVHYGQKIPHEPGE